MKDVTAAIIIENKKVLVAQRADHGKMALKWELPGGKIEPGETPQQCLKREIKEELDIEVEVLGLFGESMYCYDFGDIRLLAYFCRRLGGNISLNVHKNIKWVSSECLGELDFAPADIPLIEKLKAYL
jgi:8-oxo-dGTP diphosphatase